MPCPPTRATPITSSTLTPARRGLVRRNVDLFNESGRNRTGPCSFCVRRPVCLPYGARALCRRPLPSPLSGAPFEGTRTSAVFGPAAAKPGGSYSLRPVLTDASGPIVSLRSSVDSRRESRRPSFRRPRAASRWSRVASRRPRGSVRRTRSSPSSPTRRAHGM